MKFIKKRPFGCAEQKYLVELIPELLLVYLVAVLSPALQHSTQSSGKSLWTSTAEPPRKAKHPPSAAVWAKPMWIIMGLLAMHKWLLQYTCVCMHGNKGGLQGISSRGITHINSPLLGQLKEALQLKEPHCSRSSSVPPHESAWCKLKWSAGPLLGHGHQRRRWYWHHNVR